MLKVVGAASEAASLELLCAVVVRAPPPRRVAPMSTRLEALLAQRAAVSDALTEQREAVSVAQRGARRAVAALARHWQLDAHQRRVALIAYVHAGYDAEAAAKFLAIDGQRRGWSPKPDGELCRLVEDAWLEADLAEVLPFCDERAPADWRAMLEAVRYVEEWRLVAWARDLAASPAGVAPSTLAVLRRAEENRARVPEAIRPASLGLVVNARARSWAFRWRERWGGHFGLIRTREPLTTEEACAKVFGWGGSGRPA